MRRIAIGAVLLTGLALLLLGSENRRREAVAQTSTTSAPPVRSEPPPPPVEDLLAHYQDVEAFRGLLSKVRDQFIAINDRSKRCERFASIHVVQLNREGDVKDEERKWERVWHEGAREYRQVVRKIESESEPRYEPLEEPKASPESDAIFPFTREAKEGDYLFTLDGAEKLEDRETLRISFEPLEPLDHKFRGATWIDPWTAEPIRVRAEVAKTPALVDFVRMSFEYGPAETGHLQAREATIEGSGGLAILHRHFRLRSKLVGYRWLDGRSANDR